MITNNTFMTKVQPPMVRGVKKESVVGTHEIGDVPSPVARVRPTDAATKAKPKTIIIIRMTILGIVRSKKACQRSVKFTGVLSFFCEKRHSLALLQTQHELHQQLWQGRLCLLLVQQTITFYIKGMVLLYASMSSCLNNL